MPRFRDSRSGQFVPRSTWARSIGQGGTRFTRETIRELPAPEEQDEQLSQWERSYEDAEDYEDIEYGGAFDSPE